MTKAATAGPRVIVALDYAQPQAALEFVARVTPDLCRLKVGKELFTRAGPPLVEGLAAKGFEVFLDLKFHDIPNTVAGACAAAADMGVWMMNVHALGGRRMMEAARAAVEQGGTSTRPLIIAVTVLTSLADAELAEIGLPGNAADNVGRLARLARASGMDGVVCSPREIEPVRKECGPEFVLVTPGIRPAGARADDQRRIMGPAEALQAGSSYLVIGRPVTQAPDPVGTLRAINAEIGD